ncbi:MAG: MCP four helix bundle domain-containing protein, partial [Candidatus Rokubacteria bacterium]|nr:MCP four helix bundle domain-containing protein [Candidatus Rokubacteria bacterium]
RTATKLMLAFSIVVAIVIGVAAIGDRGMKSLKSSMGTLYQTHALGLERLKDAQIELLRTSRAVRNAILDDNEAAVRRRIADIARFRQDFRTSLEDFRRSAVLAANRDKAERLRATFDALCPKQDRILALALEQKDTEARAGIAEIREVANGMEADMEALAQAKLDLMKSSYADAEKTYDSSHYLLLMLSVMAVAAAVALGVALGQIIGRPLSKSVEVLNQVASGDFTATLDIDTRDEVGLMAKSLNRAVEEIRTALTGIRDRTSEVASAARELASASEQLASGAQEQASSLEETSASLEQISATVKQNADNARQAKQFSTGSRESAEKGGRIVGSTQVAMGEINASSKRISDIILTVDEIA